MFYNNYLVVLESGKEVYVRAHFFSGDDKGVLRFYTVPPEGCKKGEENLVARFQSFSYVVFVGVMLGQYGL